MSSPQGPTPAETYLAELTNLTRSYILLLHIRIHLNRLFNPSRDSPVLQDLVGTADFPAALNQFMYMRRECVAAHEALLEESRGLEVRIEACERLLEGDEQGSWEAEVWRLGILRSQGLVDAMLQAQFPDARDPITVFI